MRAMLRLLGVFALLVGGAAAQQPLNNDSVVKMVKAGLGDGLIVSMIQREPGRYSLTPDDMVRLKHLGVSDKILAAMLSSGTGSSSASPAQAAGPLTGANDLPPNIDIGLYYKNSGPWREMLPEVVNWKTGGVLKNLASAGIIRGDINGLVEGPHSRNSAVSPVEVLIYTPDGVAITEYQLLRLREEKDAREFRTVTGGVMHVSGGATRDVVPFDFKKLSNRTYKVLLPNLGAGEYGFLAPGAAMSASAASEG